MSTQLARRSRQRSRQQVERTTGSTGLKVLPWCRVAECYGRSRREGLQNGMSEVSPSVGKRKKS